ncbi:MAG: iron-containing alcohol dehydrogenase [Alphaproteobacteria bacterium]|nr:iron-containing alcohol dehydrogenase [Alphaproteobacteria bacterium]
MAEAEGRTGGETWQYWNPVKVRFGIGAAAELGAVIGGRSYALVTYREPFFAALAERVARAAGPPAVTLDGIGANPDFTMLDLACQGFAAASPAPAVILAIGGGSVIDAAKVVAAARGDFGRVRRFLESGAGGAELAPLPLIAVPSTAGTGSEVTCWATAWDIQRAKKFSLELLGLYPEQAVIDPALSANMPRALTISTALDALSHALESLWNRNANPVSTNHAIAAARLILADLPLAAAAPDRLDLRARLARAALLAGLAFSNTRTALAHALSYPLTLRHGVPHGIACSFTLPLVMRGALGIDRRCDAALAQIFDGEPAGGPDRLAAFLHALGVSTDPVDHGAERAEWEGLIDDAFAGARGRNYIGSEAIIKAGG